MKNSLGKLKHAPLDVQAIDLVCGTCFSLSPSRLSQEFSAASYVLVLGGKRGQTARARLVAAPTAVHCRRIPAKLSYPQTGSTAGGQTALWEFHAESLR